MSYQNPNVIFLDLVVLGCKMIAPFFSIIIPNYNNATFLRKSLFSVLNQTFQSYELIFIDDCSTDGSIKIASEIFSQYENSSVKTLLIVPPKKV